MRKNENSIIISYIIATVVLTVLVLVLFYALTPEATLSEPVVHSLYK